MGRILRASLAAGACLLAPTTASADVIITISDGYVSLDAKDATVRQILTEWARVGQTRIVGSERITGAALSLKLVRVPEAQALDTVLRSVSGYLAAPRAVPVANASRFDRILVMPTSTPPPPRAAVSPLPVQTFDSQDMPVVEDMDVDDQGVPPPGQTMPGGPAPRGPGFRQYPVTPAQESTFQPQVFPAGSNPNQPAPPPQGSPGAPAGTASPGVMPAGVSTPGMVVQPPPQAVPPEPQG